MWKDSDTEKADKNSWMYYKDMSNEYKYCNWRKSIKNNMLDDKFNNDFCQKYYNNLYNLSDDKTKKIYNEMTVFGYIRIHEILFNNNKVTKQMEIPMDLYNLILKYYWKLSDEQWIFMKDSRMIDPRRDDLSGRTVAVQFAGFDSNDINSNKSDSQLQLKKESKKSYVLMVTSRAVWMYDIAHNTMIKTDLKVPRVRFRNGLFVYCEKMKTIHCFATTYAHYSIKVDNISQSQ